MAAPSAAGNQDGLAGLCKIMQRFSGLFIVNNSPQRHGDENILAVFSVTIAALAMPAAVRPKRVVVAKSQQRVFVRIGGEIDVAAVAAVAAARSALRDELLAAERNTAVSAVSCADRNFSFVDEHGDVG